MVSQIRKRKAVRHLTKSFEVPERRACRIIGQPRSTQRYRAKVRDDEGQIIRRMHGLVRFHPRFGYRRIGQLLRREGWRINKKRVYRLWKQEGFKVPQKKCKKRRLGCTANSIQRRRTQSINEVWCWDFIHDRDEQGRSLKWFSLVDEHTRECLALEVARSITLEDVIDIIHHVMLVRGLPRYIRSDNGPEFIAEALRKYLENCHIDTLYIEPGSPWENGYAESFHSRLREGLLACEIFADLREARLLGNQWRNDYNHRRLHSSLGYQTPAEYAAECRKKEATGVFSAAPHAESPVGAAPLPLPLYADEQPDATLITIGT